MGNPTQFSREIPRRAQKLISDLYDNLPDSQPNNGLKLKATFLLAVATPIITLPFERMARPKAHLGSEAFSEIIRKAINSKTKVENASFYAGCWRYYKLEKGDAFPRFAVEGFSQKIVQSLATADALLAAKELKSDVFCANLRNALSHGSVFYLDENGNTGENIRVNRFAFVSTDRARNPQALHIQSITLAGFRVFLEKWVAWLQTPGGPE
ncbi:hypothetical protein [Roseibium alexandrii]|uniref:hypothetical protein n=1 Tax=Roseibium alexandrii TaxID=388408 RepID=UPI0037522C74